jgi:hypothetical protein
MIRHPACGTKRNYHRIYHLCNIEMLLRYHMIFRACKLLKQGALTGSTLLDRAPGDLRFSRVAEVADRCAIA